MCIFFYIPYEFSEKLVCPTKYFFTPTCTLFVLITSQKRYKRINIRPGLEINKLCEKEE